MSRSNGRRACVLAISCILSAIGACTGPDTGDCQATATCTANETDASAPAYEASDSNAPPGPDGATDRATGNADAAADASPTTDSADGAPVGCVTDDSCGPGTVCSDGGVCVPGCTESHACPGSQSCCGSVCVDTNTDTAHCGDCNIACSAKNGTAKCDQGTCAIATCSTGYIDCNRTYGDGCETPDPGPPQTPVLMTPTIGTYTGSVHAAASLKPTFTWQPVAAPGECKNTYQVQLDPTCATGDIQACKFSGATLDVADLAAASFTPAEPLAVSTTAPVGKRYYWHVRACDDLKRCSAWSKVRYVNVGRLPDDWNGDGYSDVAIERMTYQGPAYATYADVCFGGSPLNGLPDREISILRTPAPSTTPGTAAFVGDVNADGYADYAAGSPEALEVGLFLGRQAVSTAPEADRVLSGSVPTSAYGSAVSRAGDVNGDGFDDILVGAPDSSGTTGASAFLYYGLAQITTTDPKELVLNGTDEKFGTDVRGVGDLDQDGYADFAVAGTSGHIYRGGASPADKPAKDFANATALTPAGDLNGDGYDDAVFAYVPPRAPSTTVSALWGAAALGSSTVQKLFDASSGMSDMVGGRDFNGDGVSDVLIGFPLEERVIFVHGARPFLTATTLGDFNALRAPAPSIDTQFGRAVGMGDFDGNGLCDAAIGANTNAADAWHSGAVWLIPGAPLFAAFDQSKSVRSVPLSSMEPFQYGVRIAH